MTLEIAAAKADLLGAESAGEQKAATSARTDRTVTHSFMVVVEERFSQR